MKYHKWNVTPKKAIAIQKRLVKKIMLSSRSKKIKTIAGVDCSFKRRFAIASVVILKFPEMKVLEIIRAKTPATFPYIPTLLTFREGPVILKCFHKLKKKSDIMLFDGQGIAHPRRMGLATHMGILLKTPSIGCAKNPLVGKFKQPKNYKGAYSYIKDKKGKIIGVALRTRRDVKPVFVSVGHMTNLKTAIKIVLGCCQKYRIPQPIRLAHTLSKI